MSLETRENETLAKPFKLYFLVFYLIRWMKIHIALKFWKFRDNFNITIKLSSSHEPITYFWNKLRCVTLTRCKK